MCGTPFPSGSGTAFAPSYRLAFSELAMLSPLLVRRCSTSPARYFVESDQRRLSLLRIKARLDFPAAWKSPSGEGWRSAARQRADRACSTRCPIVHARTVTLRSKRANAGCSPIVAAADRYRSLRARIRIENPRLPPQLWGYPRDHTRGQHRKLLGCGKARFYGAFLKLL
jgi:hypothetical protein